jgi:hypothetical protein
MAVRAINSRFQASEFGVTSGLAEMESEQMSQTRFTGSDIASTFMRLPPTVGRLLLQQASSRMAFMDFTHQRETGSGFQTPFPTKHHPLI